MGLNDLLKENRILQGLPLAERQLIVPSCEIVEINLGDIIEEAGRHIAFLHFPINSAISITNMQDQEHTVEVSVCGKEGCIGATITLGDTRSPYVAMVQINGIAIRIPTSEVVRRLSTLRYLTAALTRYNLLVMSFAVISVGCSQFHSPAQRVARWLKTHWQRTGIESFPFSTDFLATIVGVDSKVVKQTLSDFEAQGLVRQELNLVSITDQGGLEQQTCRCYMRARASMEEYSRSVAKLAKIHDQLQQS